MFPFPEVRRQGRRRVVAEHEPASLLGGPAPSLLCSRFTGEKASRFRLTTDEQIECGGRGIKEEILEEGDRPAGMVAFGVPPSIGNTLAAPLAQRFREACLSKLNQSIECVICL